MARRIRDGTMSADLVRILNRGYPDWRGGKDELGHCYHKASTRIGDTLEPAGFPVAGRKCPRPGYDHEEYRWADAETAHRAKLLVASWASGIPVAELEADEKFRQAALPLGGS